MARRSRRLRRKNPIPTNPSRPIAGSLASDSEYCRATALVESGDLDAASSILSSLKNRYRTESKHALLENDFGTIAALRNDLETARRHFQAALTLDCGCNTAKSNLTFLEEHPAGGTMAVAVASEALPIPSAGATPKRPVRVALLSLLFNWPSTGGGTVHTAETGTFLARAGYEVQHVYASYPGWGVGKVTEPTGVPSVPLEFDRPFWNATTIKDRFRQAVDAFHPDYVIITDSWNTKPLLTESVEGYRYFLRLAALECLCPLNNVRLLYSPETGISACPRQQLATPNLCRECVARRGHQSGPLHQVERELAGFSSPDYAERLKRAFAEAEGVLVVNPLIATMVAPFSRKVHVVPSGFDRSRFPWPVSDSVTDRPSRPTRLFFAGLVDEPMKGFAVLQEACRALWKRRTDFELVVTADLPVKANPFEHFIGWQSQEALPEKLRDADILVFPTIAEEALGRTAVEAMGCGLPVIASRIGGLPFTVTEGLTGLLFEPGNASDLATRIEAMLDDPELRQRMGLAGRQRFEQDFTWDVIIDRHYRRLLAPVEIPASPPETYSPRFIESVNHPQLIRDAAEFFGLEPSQVAKMFSAYREYSEHQAYARTLGEWKTLSTEEAFLSGMLLSLTRPATIVEIGTQQGKSTRRLVDLVSYLGIPTDVICYDPVDQLRYVTQGEVDFRAEDLTGRFRTEVLDRHGSGFIFLDTHGYPLLREVIEETLQHYGNWTLAIHDCGRGLCNPQMTIARDSSKVTSFTGTWERYVLAELFEVTDPLSEQLDRCTAQGHHLRIFETQQGLGVILPAAPGESPSDDSLALAIATQA
jgi:glycosyltransferase involved in cell wall biosynthesis